MKNLTKRVITAVVAVPILIWVIGWRPWYWFAILVLLVMSAALFEFFDIALSEESHLFRLLLVLWGTAFTAGFIFLWFPDLSLSQGGSFERSGISIGGLGAVLFNLFGLWTLFLFGRAYTGAKEQLRSTWEKINFSFLGITFLAISSSYIVHLATLPSISDLQSPAGEVQINGKWLFLALATTWMADTGGFFFGILLKGPKLFPSVSPGKTWSGLAGCIVGAVSGAFAVKYILLPSLSPADCISLGTLVAIVGQIGDLAESLFKRAHQVKDAGSFLPGHGGFLDRIDALLWTGPLIYYYIIWFLSSSTH